MGGVLADGLEASLDGELYLVLLVAFVFFLHSLWYIPRTAYKMACSTVATIELMS